MLEMAFQTSGIVAGSSLRSGCPVEDRFNPTTQAAGSLGFGGPNRPQHVDNVRRLNPSNREVADRGAIVELDPMAVRPDS
jgi:hypothetical protein